MACFPKYVAASFFAVFASGCLIVAGCARSHVVTSQSTHAESVTSSAPAEPSAARPVNGPVVHEGERPTGAAAVVPAPVIALDPLLSGTETDVIPPALTSIDATHVLRVRLVRVTGKYPLLRREETLSSGPAGPTITAVRSMVADHLMVSFAPGQVVDAAAVAAAGGGAVRSQVHGSQVALLSFTYRKHDDYTDFQARLAAVPGVRVAEPDWVVQGIGTPDDAAFTQLWGMNNLGQTGGTVDADIDAPEAWNVSTGSKTVLVGIIDTGIDAVHPDLAANMWTNPGESGLDAQGNDKLNNGIDDDANGYIDDWHGWDFVNADNNPADDHYHGTHCAGTIGGVGNNGAGVTGVCWQVSLVGLKFLSSTGSGAISDAVAAQWYANAIGCDLTSNSWGGGGFSQAMKDAIDAAGAAGHLFVAAAGNAGTDNDSTPNYPSNIDSPNIIAVAATDHNDALASFSCFGATTVDLGAPGVSIYSCQPGGLYQLLSGTSMATPHVAGACALLKSANPSLTGAQIKAALLANVDPIPALAGKTVTGGRLNLAKAVIAVSGPVISPTVAMVENGNGDGFLNPGEQAVITATCASVGSAMASSVSGVLSLAAPDAAVQMEQVSATYGNLAPGQSSSGSGPYRVRLAPGTPTPHVVALVLTVSANSGGPWITPVTVTFVTTTQISGSVSRVSTGNPIGGATVSWNGPQNGATMTDATGAYFALVPDGTYQVRANAPGLLPSAPLTATVPPAAIINLSLGAPLLSVTPASLALTPAAPSGTVMISNPGDAPLIFAIASSTNQTTSGLWHETSYRNATPGAGTSWYYGDEAKRNYDTGAANSGALVFQGVQVPATAATFTCASWRITESGTTWDTSMVQISTDGGLSWAGLHVVEQPRQLRRDGLATAVEANIASTWTTLLQDTDTAGAWHQLSASLSAYAGQTVALRFWFTTVDGVGNAYEGWYVDDIRISGVIITPWMTASPTAGTVAPGASASVVVTSDYNAVGGGTTTGTLSVSSNAPVDGSATVAVTLTKPDMANLYVTDITVSDSISPAIGDGDGSWEPGETVIITPAWSNSGTAIAMGVTTSVTSPSSDVSVVAGTTTVPNIPIGGQQAAAAPWLVTIKPTCANNTVIPLNLVAIDSQGVSWSGTAQIAVAWKSRVSGVVRNAAGAPIVGATISGPAGVLATSAADGSYSYANLSAGSIFLTAAKAGGASETRTITTPPDAIWNPVLSAPVIVVNPTSLALSAPVGGTGSSALTVSNQGDGPLNWSISTVSGDDYVVATSDQAGGPSYNWTDISTTGTPVPLTGDDVTSGPYALGFSFPFYGQQFTNFRLCSNGWLSFTNTSSTFSNSPLPSISAPENLIAFFWDDLVISSGSTIFYQQIDANTTIVQYQDVTFYGDASKLLTCQVLLRANGSLVFQYLRADINNNCTIGIQNATATKGVQVAYNQAFLHDNMAVSLSPVVSLVTVSPTSGTVPPGSSSTVTATLSAGTMTPGVYNQVLYVLSNDSAAPSVPVPVSVEVKVNLPPTVNPGTATTLTGEPITIGLVGSDPEGLPITWALATLPAHGTALIVGANLTYTSAAGFTGTDICTVVATDGVRTSLPASITLTVLPALIAQPVSVVTRQGVPVNLTLSANSPRGLALTYQPTVSANGNLVGTWPTGTFTPAPGFVGTDILTYTATDGISTSAPATITVVVKADLPSGWVRGDIGITGVPGTTYQDPNPGTFISTGGGLGQSGAADSGQSATQTVTGDCDITARIPLPATTSTTARVGILIRESADAGARSVFLGLSGAKKVVWSRRATANANTTTSTYTVTAATWVRLSRRGNVVWAYRSVDGATWTLCGSTVIGMSDAMQTGTLVASGTAGVLLTASIESFVTTLPTPSVPGPIAINFQSGVDAPFVLGGTTWLIADGAPYGSRWNGVSYGTSAVTTSTYNRNSTLSLDERFDTGLSTATSSLVEIGVPNGRYTVTVCVGDAASTSGKLNPEVEGVRAVTGVVNSTTRWFTSTVTVDVLDGRLTLRCGSGATASRWAWLQIVPAPTTPAGNG